MIGDLLDAVIRDIDDHDAVIGGSCHIHTVIADAVADDHLELGECGKDLTRQRRVLVEQCLGVGALRDNVRGGFALTDGECAVVCSQGGAVMVVVGIGGVCDVDGADHG